MRETPELSPFSVVLAEIRAHRKPQVARSEGKAHRDTWDLT